MQAWEQNIRKVIPYTPGEQPKEKNIIKLNTNENPYDPSPKVMALTKQIQDLRLYPDPKVEELVHAIAQYHGLADDQVFVGVGSDDVIAMSFLTFFNGDQPILFPDITYSFYDVWADLYKIPYETVALDEAFQIVASDYARPNGGVIFPNPNAPTGIARDLDFIRTILDENQDCIVIVDEAYIDFGGESALPLLQEYKNLVITRTFSKSRSLAGLRIGYAMADAKLIAALNAVKHSYNSYTMNRPSILLGKASIEDDAYFQKTNQKIISTREWFCKELDRLGFVYPKSSANFVFASHPGVDAKEIFEKAKAAGIYVRYFDKPRINQYLRITIGTDAQMKAFVDFLEKVI